MSKWYANELAKLCQVSVRTLHHYDRIGLLKPSLRAANDYRVYSEADLSKLQQIIALKFFDFKLSDIKKLLAAQTSMTENFKIQAQLLREKAERLATASKSLNDIISSCNANKSLSWEAIIKTIEVYKMAQQLENSWVTKVLNNDELKEYAEFEKGLKTRFSLEQKEAFDRNWAALVTDVNENLSKDPDSPIGISLAKKCMDMVEGLYGPKYKHLSTTLWEKGFRGGHAGTEHGISQEAIEWLDKAIDAFYRN